VRSYLHKLGANPATRVKYNANYFYSIHLFASASKGQTSQLIFDVSGIKWYAFSGS